ncbi:Methyltransferase-like protein 2 [Hypsibius exemplaris]|uniref:tRNA N(3)-methylcytidine methyltransferase n=1 Tax=Hypsibius exemplaris TaxID=2072580 RepID=A0A1W0WL66_HYPEX|nr:Methyltransferase-like protein 2 [Hypsibius exemplaris]
MDEFTDLKRTERVRNRTLDDVSKVFEKNAWDDVEWNDEQKQAAVEKVNFNSATPLSEEDSRDYLLNAGKHWESFYKKHNDQFFKLRKWLDSEFPEILEANSRLVESGNESDERVVVFETGCGAGSTVLPLLECVKKSFVYCCDFSEAAIALLKSRPQYDPAVCNAFVADLTEDSTDHWPVQPNSVDFVIMLFTLSAIRPEKMPAVIAHLVKFLKPGGQIFFRDYGQYDLAQLRFKPAQCAGENLYVRQDGTLAYFFTQEEVRNLFTNAGLKEEQNALDKRLIVNRKRNLLMHRMWIQCKFSKPKP